MRTPTKALLWAIWLQQRSAILGIAALTVAGRLVDYFEMQGRNAGSGSDSSPLTILLAMAAFLLLFGVFNYTETDDDRGLGRFPRRLFTLPVTTLRLVGVPMLAGIASIEVLYLLWLEPLSRDGTVSPPFVGTLLGALVVFYLWALWTLERSGSLRLVMLGAVAIALFVVGMLPSFPPTPPPWWRSEIVLAGFASGLAIAAFFKAYRHVVQLRTGGAEETRPAASLFSWMTEAAPTRRTAFANASAAQFWFEWRSSGMVLPALVACVLLVVIPMSWLARGSAQDTFRYLLIVLATPIVLAVPVGIAFSKTKFWSEDLAVPAFLAVRPLSSEDLVAIKLRVAAASAGLSWLMLLVPTAVWLVSWADLGLFQRRSPAAWLALVLLVALAGMFLTWRFLVSRMWSGLLGNRRLFETSVLSLVVVVFAAVVSDAGELPGWFLSDPTRLAPFVWIAGVAVIGKYAIAMLAWRRLPWRYLRAYLPFWIAGNASFLAFGIVLSRNVEGLQTLAIVMAFLAMPLARLGLAPASLSRNRHR